jgi:hypothetical protein
MSKMWHNRKEKALGSMNMSPCMSGDFVKNNEEEKVYI